MPLLRKTRGFGSHFSFSWGNLGGAARARKGHRGK